MAWLDFLRDASWQVSCPSCGSILDMEKSRENFLHVQQARAGEGWPVLKPRSLWV